MALRFQKSLAVVALFLASTAMAVEAQKTPTPGQPATPPAKFILDPALEKKLPPNVAKKARACLSLPTLAECEACVRKATRGVDLTKLMPLPQSASTIEGNSGKTLLAWGCVGGTGI